MLTIKDMKKAVRQLKKNKAMPDQLYARLITKDGMKIYGPGTAEEIYAQWQKDIKGENET